MKRQIVMRKSSISRRIIAGNKCYLSLVLVVLQFKSKMLLRRTKISLYKVLVRLIVLYACEALALMKA